MLLDIGKGLRTDAQKGCLASGCSTTQDRGFFLILHILKEMYDILIYGNNLNLEAIDYIFRNIIILNEVNILESPN